MPVLTLAQFRDDVRRKLQVTPIYDNTGNPADIGAQPLGQADPSNVILNNAINEGIDAINRVVRVGRMMNLYQSVGAAPVTTRGPFYVDVTPTLPTGATVGEIENVVWNDGTFTNRLEPQGYYQQVKKGYEQFQNIAPATPRQFVLIGNQVGLLPAPAANGTLYFDLATTMPQLVNDTDTIAFLPVEHQVVVQYWAVAILSARAATDVEAQARFQSFSGMAAQGTAQIYAWKNGYNDDAIQSVRDTLQMMVAGLGGRMVQPPAAPPQGQGQ